MLEVGGEIAGRYEVEQSLGAGGMGAVYLAYDRKLDRRVAIKVLHKAEVGTDEARGRLLREARAAARLEHPGIVKVFDVGETKDGDAFVVMERVRGQSLRALLRDGPLEPSEALRIVAETAAALGAAHREGVVHRDVKPDNVMLRDDGRVVLLDFGLVKRVERPLTKSKTPDTPTLKALTESGAIVGTPAYLAPEQARGKSAAATDQWALAITAHELLSGRIPWEGADTAFVLAQVLMDPAPALSEHGEEVPEGADAVLARALEKKPADRFDDIESFAAALLEAYGEPLPRGPSSTPSVEVKVAREVKPPPPSDASRARHWVFAALVALGLGGFALTRLPGGETVEQPVPLEPLSDDAVVACPILETPDEEDGGWLGAAAATAVCRRLDLFVGADETRTRIPAELLELSPVPTDDYPEEPFAGDARARSLAAARRADAWIDGSVRLGDEGEVTLTLHLVSEGGERARLEVRAPALYLAGSEAALELVDDGHVPESEIDELPRTHTGLDDPRALQSLGDLNDSMFFGRLEVADCDAMARNEEISSFLKAGLYNTCGYAGADLPPLDAPLDESSPRAFAVSVVPYAMTHPAEVGPLIERLRASRNELPPRWQRFSEWLEADLLTLSGQPESAAPHYRAAMNEFPREWSHRVMAIRSSPRLLRSHASAATAWAPDNPESWAGRSEVGEDESNDATLRDRERAYRLAPRLPRFGERLALVLLEEGRTERVQTIASRYVSSFDEPLLGTSLLALLDLREARFEQAANRVSDVLLAQETLGRLVNGDGAALSVLRTTSRVLERPAQLDAVLERFVLGEAPRLQTSDFFYEPLVALVAVHATPEIGLRALDVIDRLHEERTSVGAFPEAETLRTGVRAYLEGDHEAALAAWRPMLAGERSGWINGGLLEAVGAPELARSQDAEILERTDVGGVSFGLAREAYRAERDGDAARARELANRVVAAWQIADAEVPEVARLRALLARLPAE